MLLPYFLLGVMMAHSFTVDRTIKAIFFDISLAKPILLITQLCYLYFKIHPVKLEDIVAWTLSNARK
jgi:hypothetical protein